MSASTSSKDTICRDTNVRQLEGKKDGLESLRFKTHRFS